mgnify:CR=1 FL=1
MQKKVDDFLGRCIESTKHILEEHRNELDRLVVVLLEKSDMSGKEVVEIIEEGRKDEPEKV